MVEPSETHSFVHGETALSLTEKLEPLTTVQIEAFMDAYRGKWLDAPGLLINVSKIGECFNLSLNLGQLRSLFCEFDEGDARPLDLRKGDAVLVRGQISDGSVALGLSLEHCEIRRVIPKAEFEALAEAEREADPNPPAQTSAPSSDKPRLPDAALQAWFGGFRIAYPKGSQTLAEESATAAFPHHHVARKRIRELFPNSPRGRPRKNNDLDN